MRNNNTAKGGDELEELLLKEDELMHNPKQVMRLIQIGRTSGFRDLVHRKKIWPILLQVNIDRLKDSSEFLEWNKSRDSHSQDYDQLKKDALRSFHSFKSFQNMDQDYLKKKQNELLDLLDALAKNQPSYKYFQGFHDIASIFIAIFGINTAYYMSHRLATTYLRDSFLMSFDETVMILDKLIWEIVIQSDSQFVEIFDQFDEQKLGFTMPWIITWFSHSFEDMNTICRIWDFLISSKPSAIVYVSAALILVSKNKLKAFAQEMGSGYDIGIVHTFFQNIKNKQVDISQVLQKAIQLQTRMPLEGLQPSKQLNSKAIIKEENFVKKFQIHDYIYNLILQKKARKKKIIFSFVLVGALAIGFLYFKRKSLMGYISWGNNTEL